MSGEEFGFTIVGEDRGRAITGEDELEELTAIKDQILQNSDQESQKGSKSKAVWYVRKGCLVGDKISKKIEVVRLWQEIPY